MVDMPFGDSAPNCVRTQHQAGIIFWGHRGLDSACKIPKSLKILKLFFGYITYPPLSLHHDDPSEQHEQLDDSHQKVGAHQSAPGSLAPVISQSAHLC